MLYDFHFMSSLITYTCFKSLPNNTFVLCYFCRMIVLKIAGEYLEKSDIFSWDYIGLS